MSETTHLLLPYLAAAQAQKHVTHNEALRLLDAMVQLAVLDRTRTAPPASPADGDRHVVASGASGLWAGWDLNVAYWVDGAWTRLVPRPGWLAWIAAEGIFVSWTGYAWQALGAPENVSDAVFSLVNDADPTKRALFNLSGLSTGTTRTFTLPNTSSELAILAGTQTFSGNKTFSGTLTASGATVTIGTATGTSTYGLGTGATVSGSTKTVNLGTGGASGSNTVVNIGSATGGAGGTTVINTPTVTFANAVTQVGMPQANLTAQQLGLGWATADAYNRFSINTPAMLFNNAGNGIEATFNKNTPADDAAFAFKTGFSARALIGLLGSDDFSFKVSPDGGTYHDAIQIDRNTGQVELPKATVLPGLAAVPSPPISGKLALYARSRAGAPWLDVMRPSGRDFPLQPHFGVNRIANWSPSTGTTINTEGLPITSVGTVSTPTLAAANLATSMRRWRLTSAATVDAAADQRSSGWACWRGNAAGLGGWTFVTRISLATLQATGMGFFGLYGSTAALATTLTLSAVVNCIGIGFQRGTHTRWQIVHNDGTGSPTLINMSAVFALATDPVITLTIAAVPNAASVWVRAVDEATGAVFERELPTLLPANTQFLSPRLYMNNGATAAAVAFDCSGLYIETDY
jgi:flagellin-like hook-associated protein FlgL